jgi:hypothetical protein
MIEYRNHPNTNVVEISIAGHITEADFDHVITQLKIDLEKHGKLRILEEVRDFSGIDPIALWRDVQFGFAHINDFTHAAVVTDASWMRTLSTAVGSILSAEVKAFAPFQIDDARLWLATADHLR